MTSFGSRLSEVDPGHSGLSTVTCTWSGFPKMTLVWLKSYNDPNLRLLAHLSHPDRKRGTVFICMMSVRPLADVFTPLLQYDDRER